MVIFFFFSSTQNTQCINLQFLLFSCTNYGPSRVLIASHLKKKPTHFLLSHWLKWGKLDVKGEMWVLVSRAGWWYTENTGLRSNPRCPGRMICWLWDLRKSHTFWSLSLAICKMRTVLTPLPVPASLSLILASVRLFIHPWRENVNTAPHSSYPAELTAQWGHTLLK